MLTMMQCPLQLLLSAALNISAIGAPACPVQPAPYSQQNLGAMLRSAHLLGVAGVLACSRNCAPLSPVVSKASAGAAELMKLHSCRSMPRTLADAAAKGWAVVGAAADDDAVPLTELRVDRPTVLVMGE